MRKFGKMIPFTYLTVDLSNDIKYLPQEVFGPALSPLACLTSSFTPFGCSSRVTHVNGHHVSQLVHLHVGHHVSHHVGHHVGHHFGHHVGHHVSHLEGPIISRVLHISTLSVM